MPKAALPSVLCCERLTKEMRHQVTELAIGLVELYDLHSHVHDVCAGLWILQRERNPKHSCDFLDVLWMGLLKAS